MRREVILPASSAATGVARAALDDVIPPPELAQPDPVLETGFAPQAQMPALAATNNIVWKGQSAPDLAALRARYGPVEIRKRGGGQGYVAVRS